MKLLKILLLAIALHGVAANANALRVITEEWPPFNYRENGQAAGLGVEMVKALLAESGLSSESSPHVRIEFQPWNRAYATALNTPNVLLFTLGRNPDRESSFHWLFKVAPREIWLFRLAGASTMQVNSLDDVRHARVGTGPREDGSTQALLKAGFIEGKNLDIVNGVDPDQQNLRKLVLGRIDYLAGHQMSLAYAAHGLKIDFGKIERLIRLTGDDPGYWVALSRDSAPALVEKLLAAADRLEAQGVFAALREKYLGKVK